MVEPVKTVEVEYVKGNLPQTGTPIGVLIGDLRDGTSLCVKVTCHCVFHIINVDPCKVANNGETVHNDTYSLQTVQEACHGPTGKANAVTTEVREAIFDGKTHSMVVGGTVLIARCSVDQTTAESNVVYSKSVTGSYDAHEFSDFFHCCETFTHKLSDCTGSFHTQADLKKTAGAAEINRLDEVCLPVVVDLSIDKTGQNAVDPSVVDTKCGTTLFIPSLS